MRLLTLPLLAVLSLAACTEAPPAEDPVRSVRTLTVQPGSASLQHEYAGEVRARSESSLGFQVPGKLLSRQAQLGEQVLAGKALARLDARDLQLGQQAARASLGAAQSQLAMNESEFKRYKELRDQGFISSVELERRETSLKAARAQMEQAQAQSALQTNQTGYAVLTAQTSGVVTAVLAEPGAVLAAGMPVLRLAHDGPRDVVFSVPEGRVDAVRALMGRAGALQVKLGGAEAPVAASVREVSAAADPATRTFLVKADLGPAAARLGQTATVLVQAPLSDAIKLPLNAVYGDKGQSAVWLVDSSSMTVRQQPITMGGAEGNLVLVAQGLKTGDVVVTAGVHSLHQGQKVRWYNPPVAVQPAGSGQPAQAVPAVPAPPATPDAAPASAASR